MYLQDCPLAHLAEDAHGRTVRLVRIADVSRTSANNWHSQSHYEEVIMKLVFRLPRCNSWPARRFEHMIPHLYNILASVAQCADSKYDFSHPQHSTLCIVIVYLPLQFPLDLPDYSLLTNIALGCLRHVFMLAKALSIYSKLRSTIR
jgi:hypothetical protein